MTESAVIECGFAEVGAGEWLAAKGQPVAFFGSLSRRPRRGFAVRDRSCLARIGTAGKARFASARRPFLTYIPCAAEIHAVSDKVLLAPAAARKGDFTLRPIPMSVRSSMCVTDFDVPAENGGSGGDVSGAAFVVAATESRTARQPLAEGDVLSVRPEALVAWTGRRPTGFCPRLGLLDVLLPRAPKDLLLTFYGPGVVWYEGADAGSRQVSAIPGRRAC